MESIKAADPHVVDFMAYQEGDKLTKRSPAVTFGKGGKRPMQRGESAVVEESPSVPTGAAESLGPDFISQELELDLTTIAH